MFSKTDRKVLEDILTHASRKYRVPRPKLKVIRKPKLRVFGWSEGPGITLNESFHGHNIHTLLHELAHWITDHVFEDEEYHAHGPQFCTIYMHLLAGYRVLPVTGFRELANQWGVELDESIVTPY